MRRRTKPAKAKVEAKRPVVRKSAKNEGSGVGDLEKRLTEALGQLQTRDRELVEAQEQQTATAEILRVMSASPTDLTPVLNTVVQSAARFCGSEDASLFQLDGDTLRQDANHGPVGDIAGFRVPVVRGTVGGRTVLERRAVHVADIQAEVEEFPEASAIARRVGHRTILSVPLLREGTPIGVLQLRRAEVNPFTDKQIALLQTFADQAVIAIENVRLFNETKEALEQQRASSEILGVISSSPTNVQPVFDVIVQSAVRLCGGLHSNVYRVENGLIHLVAHHNFSPAALEHLQRRFPMPVSQGEGLASRVIREGIPVYVHDAQTDPEVTEMTRRTARALGARSVLSVPMLRDRVGIGVIVVSRGKVKPFSDKEIALIRTFADQAVIAIENVRLFKELQARNRDLTEALEQQTATSEILKVISSSPTDLTPVFESLLDNALRLCRAEAGILWLWDETTGSFLPKGMRGAPERYAEFISRGPVRPAPETGLGRIARDRRVVHIADVAADDLYRQRDPLRVATVEILGARTFLAVPMLREGALVGTFTVYRQRVEPFSERQIALIQTFADQAVIAIENVRLFKELEQKTRELQAASQHKSEFLANMSHELRTPLNAIIGFSEALTERMFGDLNEKQDEYLRDIYASGQHLLSLINDILDLSKIEAGRMELELTDFDLPQAISNALILVRERAGRRGIALHQAVDQRLGQIRGDERKVKQVLLNLLSNALKFTPEGGRVDVKARVVDGLAEISVADTGVGIAPEDQEAVFEEFRQVGTADKKVEGTGLGLTLSRKFIELHGGRIWVKSQMGLGSTFTFTLPLTT